MIRPDTRRGECWAIISINSLHVSRFLNTEGGNQRESIIHRIVVRIVRVLATLRRAPIVDNSMVVVRLITVPIPCSDAYVSRSRGSSQIWMIIGRTRLIYEYRNGRCLLDEINLHYTTLSRLVASSVDAGGGNEEGEGFAVGKLVDDDRPLTSIRWTALPLSFTCNFGDKSQRRKERKRFALTKITTIWNRFGKKIDSSKKCI